MGLVNGILFNLRGFWFGIRTGKLLFWGLIRFLIVLIITGLLIGFILAYHGAIMDLIWTKPHSPWLIWLWYLLSWIISTLLIVLSVLFSYLVSQVFFSVFIMDLMSRITERTVTGAVISPTKISLWKLFLWLIKQEIPRTIIPVILVLILMIIGWFSVVFAPILTVLSPCIAVMFLAWDNTDLLPARRMASFWARFRMFLKSIPFHLGFGLPFLVPALNILFLSFAPVGATLYQLDRMKAEKGRNPANSPQDRRSSE